MAQQGGKGNRRGGYRSQGGGQRPQGGGRQGPQSGKQQAPLAGGGPGTAPYNFVPFGRPMTAAELAGEEGTPRYSGHLDLTLTPLTPLFVGDGAATTSLRWPADDSRLWIPGSSIRGAVSAIAGAILGGPVLASDDAVFTRAPFAPQTNVASRESRAFHDAYKKARRPQGGYQLQNEELGLLVRVKGEIRLQPAERFRVNWSVLSSDLLGKPCAPIVTKKPEPPADRVAREALVKKLGAELEQANLQLKAVEIKASTRERFHTQIDEIALATQSTGRLRRGYLLLTGLGGTNVWNAVVAVPEFDETGRPVESLPVESSAIRSAIAYLAQYRKEGLEIQGMRALLDSTARYQPIPVFYDEDVGRVTRIGFSGGFAVAGSSWREVVARAWERAAGGEAKSEEPYAIEALFGTVRLPAGPQRPVVGLAGDAPELSIAGRVSFGHALSAPRSAGVEAELTHQRVTLSSPKRSSVHTRLVQGADVLRSYHDVNEARARGRELYWHRWRGAADPNNDDDRWKAACREHREMAPGDIVADPEYGEAATGSNRVYIPVKSGIPLTARVFFTELSELELGALGYALTLGAGSDDPRSARHAHKLGALKPLGLGSVHIAAELHLDRPDRWADWAAGWAAAASGHELDGFVEAFRSFAASHGRGPQLEALEVLTAWRDRPDRNATKEMDIHDHARRKRLPEISGVARPRDP